MPARIVRLRSDASSEADGLPERAPKAIIDADHRQAAVNGLWTFVMLSPEQNAAVARWLGKNSGRPKVALLLWQELFTALERETGEITLTRYELANGWAPAPTRSPASWASSPASARSRSTGRRSLACAAGPRGLQDEPERRDQPGRRRPRPRPGPGSQAAPRGAVLGPVERDPRAPTPTSARPTPNHALRASGAPQQPSIRPGRASTAFSSPASRSSLRCGRSPTDC